MALLGGTDNSTRGRDFFSRDFQQDGLVGGILTVSENANEQK